MTLHLFTMLSDVVDVDEALMSADQRVQVVDQVWRYAATSTQHEQFRIWVAMSPYLRGRTRDEVLDSTEARVRVAAAGNPVLAPHERRQLLRGRTGLSTLRQALARSTAPQVLAELFEDLMPRWGALSDRTRRSFLPAIGSALEHARWMLAKPDAIDVHDAVLAATGLTADPQVQARLDTTIQGVATLMVGDALRLSQTTREHPSAAAVVVSSVLGLVSDTALADVLTDRSHLIPAVNLWSVLALRRPLPADVIVGVLERLADDAHWSDEVFRGSRTQRRGVPNIGDLALWLQHVVDHPQRCLDVIEPALRTADARTRGVWFEARELAHAVLAGDPLTAPWQAVRVRFRSALTARTTTTIDLDAVRAVALRPESSVDWRLAAWSCWHGQDEAGAEQAARDAGYMPVLIAALVERFHPRLDDVLARSGSRDEDRSRYAREAMLILAERMPESAMRMRALLPLLGPTGMLFMPWPILSSTLEWIAQMTDLGAMFAQLCLEHLTGPEDWAVFERLSETWQGTTGELFGAVASLRTP